MGEGAIGQLAQKDAEGNLMQEKKKHSEAHKTINVPTKLHKKFLDPLAQGGVGGVSFSPT